ncbi:imidazole glycerol phosphate synthase subunit HisH [Xenorhabdus bovienii]|uniref:imidazole glycerol phosphate synthase subunit HisH n=1 Tax=Xenorhabdus bovienii TaxID=40576 RepID=UPI0023B2E05A|nr:imidazole glycerol phosphate synthase subunit HisH [Xenorhabdus bovienii]MDE9517145.1 imidazole glycerol phosphate synthase subunit HisH [Xenorhabdus bovienii]
MIKIINYGMGNCGSIQNMLRHLGVDSEIITEPKQLLNASVIILPGVGSFDHGITKLGPFRDILDEAVIKRKIPFLGICLGMQLLFNSSEEGKLPGLGWISGSVKKFDFSSLQNTKRLVIPHMGWNEVWAATENSLIGLNESRERFYFVHSYYVSLNDPKYIFARCNYGYDFTCAVHKNNIYGVQFHPEKSHIFGKNFFKNFIELVKCSKHV